MWSQAWIWQHAWHAFIGVGCFVFWALFQGLGSYGVHRGAVDQIYEEQRSRERIMESYERDHPE
jgi:hypothetical protein